jgi:hypothetical protein
MPQQLSIVPRGLAGGADAPGGDGVFQMRNRRQRVAEQAHVQCLFGGFDQSVKGAVERGVIVILRAAVLRGD